MTLEAAATPPTSDAVREALERMRQTAEGLRGWERLDGTEAMDEEYHADVAALDAEAHAILTAALAGRADAAKVDYSRLVASIECVVDGWEQMRDKALVPGDGGPILNKNAPLSVALEMLRFAVTLPAYRALAPQPTTEEASDE